MAKDMNNKGFTLMEILVVIGILGVLILVSLFMGMGNYRGDAFRAEVETLGTILQTARINALNNIDQKRHGVAIHPSGFDDYVIFEGDTYSSADHSRDISVKASYSVQFSLTTPTEIVFDQLSGDANYDGDLTFIDPSNNMTAIISINHEGKISW